METKPWFDPEQKLPEKGQQVLMAYEFGTGWIYDVGAWDDILHEWFNARQYVLIPPHLWQEITPPDVTPT